MGPEVLLLLLAGGGMAAMSVLMGDDDDASDGADDDAPDNTDDDDNDTIDLTDWTEIRVAGSDGDDLMDMSDPAMFDPDGTGEIEQVPDIAADENLVYDGGEGNDTLTIGHRFQNSEEDVGRAEALGGDGDDIITFQNMSLVQQFGDGGDGNDVLSAHAGYPNAQTTLLGGAGDDVLTGSAGSLDGGAGNDTLIAMPLGRGTIASVDDSDVITLTGGEGSDVFQSSAISSWEGAIQDADNPFKYTPASTMPNVLITDFEAGTDQLHLYPFLFSSHLLKDISITEDADGSVVTATYEGRDDFDLVHTVTLEGATGISSDDIVLAEWDSTLNPNAVPALLPEQGASDAEGRDVYVWGTDGDENWEVTDVHNIRGHLGDGDDTLSFIAADDGGGYQPPVQYVPPYPLQVDLDSTVAIEDQPPSFDRVDGGDGNDLIEFDFSARTAIQRETMHSSYISGGAGNDTLIGTVTNHDIVGGEGDDHINVTTHSGYDIYAHTPLVGVYAGEGSDNVTVSGDMSLFLGDDEDSDHLTIIPGREDGFTVYASDLTDADDVTVRVPVHLLDRLVVTAGSSSAAFSYADSAEDTSEHGPVVSILRVDGELTRPLYDPGNPDSLIRVVGV